MDIKHKGALFETLAAAWLLKQGYEVHRNISQHGLFDLIIFNPNTGIFTGVDVTSDKKMVRKKNGREYTYWGKSDFIKVREMQDRNGKVLLVNPDTYEVYWHPKFLT